MSIATIVLGESGAGKTFSLRNLNPADTLLIQAVKKPLPFKAKHWSILTKDNPDGSIYVTDKSDVIVKAMQRTKKKIIVLDDFQYTMSNEFMRRVLDKETGAAAFTKYNEIARFAWDILTASANLSDDKRVYILSHTQTDESGHTKIKTIGKLLDEKITIEGLVTIVLRTHVINGVNVFSTKNNGSDTVKTPADMFETDHIDNDLAIVDAAIVDYFTQPKE
jgi:hypothetical protein